MKAKTLLYLLITGLTVFSLLGAAPALVSASQPTQTGGITVCSIPRISQGVAYKGGSAESLAWGPAALAVAPDGSFWVADPAGNRVLQYSPACKLLRRIPLQRLAVGVNDIEVTANGVYLLDAAAASPKVVRLSLKGVPAGSLPIPAEVKAGLSGLSMTPDGVLLVEQEGGSFTYALTDPAGLPISKEFNPDLRRSTVSDLPSVTEEAFSSQAAGQRLIYTLPDSSRMALVERAELVNGVIAVDQTVRLYAPDGEQVGEARVPLSDQHTYVANPVAAAPDGQVYALVTRPNGAEIRRLEFVRELQPILPQAEPEEVPAEDQPLAGQGASPQAVST